MGPAVRPSGDATSTRRTPVRTCVGCRRRDGQAALLRVVADRTASGPAGEWSVVPDEPRRREGRGAYVHPDRSCLHLAIQRRAFARALRQEGPVDTGTLERWIEQHA